MTQLISPSGQKNTEFAAWNIANKYRAGDLVVYTGSIYEANDDIPAGTAWATGVSGATWTETVTGGGGSYGNSNVVTLMSAFGSNTVSTTGDITAGNVIANVNGFAIGYRDVPQVTASNATLALSDAGKHYYSTTAGNLTLTIPTNTSVAFATGTAVTIVVQAAGNVLVNAASGVTLYMGGNSTAANRVVETYGMATLLKVASDTWFINGASVS